MMETEMLAMELALESRLREFVFSLKWQLDRGVCVSDDVWERLAALLEEYRACVGSLNDPVVDTKWKQMVWVLAAAHTDQAREDLIRDWFAQMFKSVFFHYRKQ